MAGRHPVDFVQSVQRWYAGLDRRSTANLDLERQIIGERIQIFYDCRATSPSLLERRVCGLDVDSSSSRGGHTASLI